MLKGESGFLKVDQVPATNVEDFKMLLKLIGLPEKAKIQKECEDSDGSCSPTESDCSSQVRANEENANPDKVKSKLSFHETIQPSQIDALLNEVSPIDQMGSSLIDSDIKESKTILDLINERPNEKKFDLVTQDD